MRLLDIILFWRTRKNPWEGVRFDDRSERNIATLAPEAQRKAREWMRRCCDAGLNVIITDAHRAWAAQDALYAQGRTAPGAIVTNARGGRSYHNYGVAWDFYGFTEDGKIIWDGPIHDKAGAIAVKMGLEWGGNWRGGLVDRPHIQLGDLPPVTYLYERAIKNGKGVA